MDGIDFHRAMHRPGTIVEVGAAQAWPLAELPGSRVLAFEPVPSAFARLKRSVQERFGLSSHIRLNNAALGATRGIVRLEVPGGEDGGDGEPVSFEVAMITLDAFALPDVTAIKLDAEGAERDVLLGAAKTVRRCRPVISMAVEARHRDGAVRDVSLLLAPLGYEGYFSAGGAWRTADDADGSVTAFYFVPGERRGELAQLGRLPAA